MLITNLHSDGSVDLIVSVAPLTRRCIGPGSDIGDLPGEIRASIEAHWAEDVGDGETRAERWHRLQAEAEGPPPSLEEVKPAALARIDAEAEAERLRHVTPGAGQAMVYMAKEAQARACLADPAPDPQDYPLLACTIGIERHPVTGDLATTVQEVAAIVIAVAGGWAQVAAGIEAARLAAKAAVEAAQSSEEVAAVFPIVWQGP